MTRGLAALLVASAIAGCALVAGIERGELAPSFDASDTPEAGNGDGGCPSDMVRITRRPGPASTASAARFCMDRTEVTNAAYARFLLEPLPLAEQPPECAWNTSYEASSAIVSGPRDAPVISLDWCDAWAYCRWSGKRMCGRVGGGPIAFELAGSLDDEWTVACTGSGERTFAYGPSYLPTACIAEDNGAPSGPMPVTSAPACVGDGLYDLSGNVWEMEDACSPNPDAGNSRDQDLCRRRGGSFNESERCLGCGLCSGALKPRAAKSNETGFRCCAD
jgi:formylglycine-generating enzyme